MTMSPQDAAAALRDIERAETRSAMLSDYQYAAPHFLIWGTPLIVGYGLTSMLPPHMMAGVGGALILMGIWMRRV